MLLLPLPKLHISNESLTARGVATLRMLNDLRYTRDPRLQTVWNLPQPLQPDPLPVEVVEEEIVHEYNEDEAIPLEERATPILERRGLLPTAKLLGWSPSTRLTNKQRQMLETCGIGQEGFADSFLCYALNNGLFEAIADRIRTSADRYKCGASLHEHQSGSLAQCPYVEREPREFERLSTASVI